MNVSDLNDNLKPGTNNLTPFDTNIVSATAFAEVGIYITDRENALEVCQKLANSVGAYLIPDITGKFKLIRLETDYAGAAAYEVTREDMEEYSLEISQKLDVVGASKLAYCKNWTLQDSGLAGGIPSNNVALFAKEWWYSVTKDATTLSRYQQNAEPPQKDIYLVTTAAADAESARLLNIKKTPRFIYTATYFSHLLLVELGEWIKITYPRFGLDAGKTGMVVSVDRDWLRGRVTIGVLI